MLWPAFDLLATEKSHWNYRPTANFAIHSVATHKVTHNQDLFDIHDLSIGHDRQRNQDVKGHSVGKKMS